MSHAFPTRRSSELQRQEAERLDIEVTDVQVAGALEQIAQQNSMTEGQFLTMLRNRGVIPTTLIEQIRAQIAWQGVIQRRVRPNVEIAPERRLVGNECVSTCRSRV